MKESQQIGSLYGKVLNKDGTIALMAIILLSFFIWVYWYSLQEMHAVHSAQTNELKEIRKAEIEQNDILKDIRYALRQADGLTLRTDAR